MLHSTSPAPEKGRRCITLYADWDTQDALRKWAQEAGFDLSWNYDGWPIEARSFQFHVTIAVSSNEVALPVGVRWIEPVTVEPAGFGLMGKTATCR